MSNFAIELRNLGYAYVRDNWILRHLDASVERGSILSILGPNGRGKSTLLKLILSAMPPTEGEVVVHGLTAFVPQLFHVSFDFSVLDMVLMGRAKRIRTFALPSSQDEAAALQALKHFGIEEMAHRAFHELSGGQRQLVLFARALAAQADILILDEPMASLDLRHQTAALHWLSRLAREQQMTIVFTTHLPQHALAIADKTLLMHAANQFQWGQSDTVLSESNLSELYEVKVKRVGFEHDGRLLHTFVPVRDSRPDTSIG